MELKVTIPGACLAMDLEEEREKSIFRTVAGILVDRKEVAGDPIMTPPDSEYEEDTDECEGAVEEVTEETKEEEHEPTEYGYKGFMIVRCEHCGRIKAFSSNKKIMFFRCSECGGYTELNDMARLFVNCECGSRFRYMTNIRDSTFDVNCINCGSPVAVKWNAKKELYETIRRGFRWGAADGPRRSFRSSNTCRIDTR